MPDQADGLRRNNTGFDSEHIKKAGTTNDNHSNVVYLFPSSSTDPGPENKNQKGLGGVLPAQTSNMDGPATGDPKDEFDVLMDKAAGNLQTDPGKVEDVIRGGNQMDNDDILTKYMDKIDHDQVQLRQDIKESEHNAEVRSNRVEERMDNRLNRIEDMISKQGEKIDKVSDRVHADIDGMKKWTLGLVISTMALIVAAIVAIAVMALRVIGKV